MKKTFTTHRKNLKTLVLALKQSCSQWKKLSIERGKPINKKI